MANYNNTVVKCKNPEVLKTVIKDGKLDFSRVPIGKKVWHELKNVSNDFTEAKIISRSSTFHDVITELSMMFTEDVITGEYIFEGDYGIEHPVNEYKRGECEEIDLLYCPLFGHESHVKGEQPDIDLDALVAISTVLKDKPGKLIYEYTQDDKWKIVAEIYYGLINIDVYAYPPVKEPEPVEFDDPFKN